MDKVTYQPLPGKGFGPFRRDRVWLADDHLLSVKSSRVLDVYERFYFADIQGIFFRDRRGEHFMILAACLVPCLSFLGLALVLHWAWWLPFLPLAAWTTAYAILGPQGECRIQTRLGTHLLPAISRPQAYGFLLNHVTPQIERAQGVLDPAALRPAPPGATTSYSPPPLWDLVARKEPNRGRSFEAVFALVAMAGLFSLWNQRGQHGAFFDWTEYALSFLGMAGVLVALVRAYRIDVGGPTLGCLWGLIGTQAIYTVGVGVFASIQNAAPRLPGAARYHDQHPIRIMPVLLPYATAMEGLCIALAIVGLLLVIDRKNRQPA